MVHAHAVQNTKVTKLAYTSHSFTSVFSKCYAYVHVIDSCVLCNIICQVGGGGNYPLPLPVADPGRGGGGAKGAIAPPPPFVNPT